MYGTVIAALRIYRAAVNYDVDRICLAVGNADCVSAAAANCVNNAVGNSDYTCPVRVAAVACADSDCACAGAAISGICVDSAAAYIYAVKSAAVGGAYCSAVKVAAAGISECTAVCRNYAAAYVYRANAAVSGAADACGAIISPCFDYAARNIDVGYIG